MHLFPIVVIACWRGQGNGASNSFGNCLWSSGGSQNVNRNFLSSFLFLEMTCFWCNSRVFGFGWKERGGIDGMFLVRKAKLFPSKLAYDWSDERLFIAALSLTCLLGQGDRERLHGSCGVLYSVV